MFVSYVALVARCWLMLLTVQREQRVIPAESGHTDPPHHLLSFSCRYLSFKSSLFCEISVLMSCLSVCRWVSFLVPLKTKMFPWGKQSFRISILVLHLIIFPNSSVLSLFPSKKKMCGQTTGAWRVQLGLWRSLQCFLLNFTVRVCNLGLPGPCK